MRRLAPVLAFIALLAPITSNASPQDFRETEIFGLKLKIPSGVKLKTERPQVDFVLLEFTENNRLILNGYLGNFAAPTKSLARRRRTKNGLLATDTLMLNGLISKEVLLDRGEWAWPRYAHFWYKTLSRREAAVSDGIIADTLEK